MPREIIILKCTSHMALVVAQGCVVPAAFVLERRDTRSTAGGHW